MTAQFAFQPEEQLQPQPAKWLRALPRAKSRSSLPFIASGAVVVVVLVQLFLSVALANGAYETERLETVRVQEQRNLTAASGDLVRVQSPQYLVNNAAALGMISNSNAVYLRLSDGAVFGSPMPANGGTLAGTNIQNSLLAGIPLVTDVAAAQAAAAQASASAATADANRAGSTPGTPATPGVPAAAGQAGSVPFEGGLPAVHTR